MCIDRLSEMRLPSGIVKHRLAPPRAILLCVVFMKWSTKLRDHEIPMGPRLPGFLAFMDPRRISRADVPSRPHARRWRAEIQPGTSRPIGDVRWRAGRNKKAMAQKTPARTDGAVPALHVWHDAAGAVETAIHR